ncbi:allantoinase PuuE [Nitrincola tapanii]|uniref:Allantoinase PuuE n=1 Tax=Nitrincola tapanii TaxID=1708751 RepID=A0A5A9W2T5_9GAMM|nr:allantoinase PuuE [Nitrincola tapanii]KAA0874415.1 allantoinase PuuE [Nitrincola tapanii]
MSDTAYPRDLVGYAGQPPHAQWPGQARLALNFVLNYEEGGEMSVLHGDAHAETFLSEMASPTPYPDRHLSMESIYEYGSRAGVWRILAEFERRQLPLTIFAVAMAMQRHPSLVAEFQRLNCDIVCHGLRWIHYQQMPEAQERAHMQEAVRILTELTGHSPLGWYTGRDSPNTRRLLVEQGGFLYDSDYYGDDLPFWTEVSLSDGSQKPHLILPYTLDCNDMRFSSSQGFAEGDEFFRYLKDSFDVLYAEGAERPKMMSVGLHCRLIGRPGRFRALQRFLDYVQSHDQVWVTRRLEIAQHWQQTHPYTGTEAG